MEENGFPPQKVCFDMFRGALEVFVLYCCLLFIILLSLTHIIQTAVLRSTLSLLCSFPLGGILLSPVQFSLS